MMMMIPFQKKHSALLDDIFLHILQGTEEQYNYHHYASSHPKIQSHDTAYC